MQFIATQEQMEVVIPEWCAADGLADDPVTVSRFSGLAVKLLGILPGEASLDDVYSLGPRPGTLIGSAAPTRAIAPL
jgi:hypothetical protein